jgi:RTX calcium-binding nonapeptide repeat (4 copies)
MRRMLAVAVAAALSLAPAALAATVSSDGRNVRFRAAPGEGNELRVLPHESGVRFTGSSPIAAGENCTAVREGDVRCGPPPPSRVVVTTRTGDRDDFVFVRVGLLFLGRGDDLGRGQGAIVGGPGKDDLRVALGEGIFSGGPGADELIGRSGEDALDGGSGPDLIVGNGGADSLEGEQGNDQIAGGPGRDRIVPERGRDVVAAGAGNDLVSVADGDRDDVRCGRGRDRVDVDRRDEIRGCERVTFGMRD